MLIDQSLLTVTQELTVGLLPYLKIENGRQFAQDTLDLMGDYLRLGRELDPDDLYERFDNLNEEDLSTYADLDGETPESVWQAILTHVALFCCHLYRERGYRYLPQTLESIDNQTIYHYFDYYRDCLEQLPSLVQDLAQTIESMDELGLEDTYQLRS